jgi:hypothetical protein
MTADQDPHKIPTPHTPHRTLPAPRHSGAARWATSWVLSAVVKLAPTSRNWRMPASPARYRTARGQYVSHHAGPINDLGIRSRETLRLLRGRRGSSLAAEPVVPDTGRMRHGAVNVPRLRRPVRHVICPDASRVPSAKIIHRRSPETACRESIDSWTVTLRGGAEHPAVIGGRLDVMTRADGSADPGARPGWRWDVALSLPGHRRTHRQGQLARPTGSPTAQTAAGCCRLPG